MQSELQQAETTIGDMQLHDARSQQELQQLRLASRTSGQYSAAQLNQFEEAAHKAFADLLAELQTCVSTAQAQRRHLGGLTAQRMVAKSEIQQLALPRSHLENSLQAIASAA